MLVSFAFLYLIKIAFAKSSSRIINQAYERINYEQATGNYVDSHYLEVHSIDSSQFAPSSSGDRDGHIIGLAFQNNDNYWSSREPNTDEFHSSIDISFNDPTILEAFLITSLNDKESHNRITYHGFPTKIKVYTALNDEPLSLNTIFVGTPTSPLNIAQFVFKNPVECTRLKLEFLDVTEDHKNAGGAKSACIKYINFIQKLDYNDIKYVLPNGDYDNSIYLDFHLIPDSMYDYTSSGDRDGHEIKNAFDTDDAAFWVANIESDGTKGSHIIINFHKTTLFEGLLLQGYEYTKNRKTTYPGFPLKVNFYYSIGNEDFKLHTKFSGEPSDKKEVYQFIPPEKVLCDRIKIEFVEVMYDSRISNTYSAAINKIRLYQSFENEGKPFQKVNGVYSDGDYLSTHMVPAEDFEIRSVGGDQEGHPISYTKDDDVTTYWVSSKPNSETYHNEVIAEFKKATLLEAVLFDPVLETINKVVTFSGFPIRFKIYTALNDEEFSLQASFVGMPDNSINRVQYVLPNVVNCTKVKLEFVEVTPFVYKSSNRDLHAGASKFMFVKKAEYDLLPYQENQGYPESHLIPKSKFKYSCTGSQGKYPIDNAFDDKTDTFWSSSFENKDSKYASIFIEFIQPVKLEGFLLGIFYNKIAATKHYAGYPKRLNVLVSNNDEPYKLKATFTGNPKDIEFYQFGLRDPVICSKLQLEFVEVTTNGFYMSWAQYPSLSYVKLLGELIDYSNIDQDDFSTQYVNNSFPLNGVNDTNFIVNDLPNDNDYLFVVERQFYFRNVSFSCPDSSMSAIKSNHSNHVTVENCQFNSCSVKNSIGNGGAIISLNCVLTCSNSDFSNCKSKVNGGGGGIFVHLKEDINEPLIIDKCNFNHCSATFGGALYLFSNKASNKITIQNCVFEYNSIIESTSKSPSSLYGGSAIYLQAIRAMTRRCKFRFNGGDSSMKIDHNIENAAYQLDKEIGIKSTVLINKCQFEIDSSAKSSLSYFGGSAETAKIDVKKCIFVGKPLENAHHIHVELHANKVKEPKLKIQSCKFSSDKQKSINLNLDDLSGSPVIFNTNMQVFNYNGENSDKPNSKKFLVISLSFIGAGILVLVVLIAVFIKIRLNKKIDDKNDPLNPTVENDL